MGMTQRPTLYELRDDERFKLSFKESFQLFVLSVIDRKEYLKQKERIKNINNERAKEKYQKWISHKPTPPPAPPKKRYNNNEVIRLKTRWVRG